MNDDQYLERTPDHVAKVRAMREAAEKQMNRFTCLADYDARRVVGHGPKPAPVSAETASPSQASERSKKASAKPASNQPALDFPPAPVERGDDDGGQA
jgi:hypothetical protein